jgi:hypothetical protein
MAVSLVPQTGRWAYPAGATGLSQFQFVTFNGSGQLVTPASGVFAVVLDDAPPLLAGAPGPYVVGVDYGIVFQGVQKTLLGANLAAGVPVITNAAGAAIAATGAGNVILGWTMEAGSSGDIVPVLLDRSLHN